MTSDETIHHIVSNIAISGLIPHHIVSIYDIFHQTNVIFVIFCTTLRCCHWQD